MKNLLYGMVTAILITQTTLTSMAQIKPLSFVEYDLPNGLHVILHEDHRAPVVATVVHYKVGSRDEDPSRTGFAHFFEHLMFESTDKIERGTIDKLINGAGGQLNAYTSNDETVYHFVVPSNQFRLALWIEAQRMRKLHVNEIGVETQRGVVKEERSNRYDNAAYGGWIEKTQEIVAKGTPYAWAPIGSAQHIDSASISEFVAFYNKYYQPNNAILVVSGDFDEKLARETIDAYFGGYAEAPAPPRPDFKQQPQDPETYRETINDEKARLPGVFMAWYGIGKKDPDAYAADLLGTILSDGESSRLYKNVVDSQQLAVQATFFNRALEYGGMSMAVAIAGPGKSTEQAEAAVLQTLQKIADEGVSDAELEKAKVIAEVRVIGAQSDMHSIALNLADGYRYFHNTGMINDELANYKKVTKADIQRVAKRIFGRTPRVVLTYVPAKG
ncbi:MAG: putative zinc protease [Chlorobi bacterium]|nr:putative zinc protease [Chlorobiota bacterium]